MTTEEITSRCQHCGGSKKEHARKAPYRCPLNLRDSRSESYWEPWTVEAYVDAVQTGRQAAVAPAEPQEAPVIPQVTFEAPAPRTLDLTPNFSGMFRQFARDAEHAGLGLGAALYSAQFQHPVGNDYAVRAAILRAVQSYLAPVTIALNLATSVAEIEQIRTVMAHTLAKVDAWASEFEGLSEPQEEE